MIYHRFITKWAIPVSSQKPKDLRNRLRLSFVSGDTCFFLITCQDLKMVYSLKTQLEPLLLLDCRVTDGGSSDFCYVWQSCDPSCPHGVNSSCWRLLRGWSKGPVPAWHRSVWLWHSPSIPATIFFHTFRSSPRCRKKNPQELQVHLASKLSSSLTGLLNQTWNMGSNTSKTKSNEFTLHRSNISVPPPFPILQVIR